MGALWDYVRGPSGCHACKSRARCAHSTPPLPSLLLRAHGRTLAASLMMPTICSASGKHVHR